jgi:excisionase family DNA binding protein
MKRNLRMEVTDVKLLRIDEAAEATGHRESTWRKWILLRRVPFVKIGRSVRIESSVLERMLAEGRVPAREE